MYAQVIGPVHIAVQAIYKNYTFSELYEIIALCTVLKCNIRSIYPKIDFREYMAIMNNVFTSASSIIANDEIIILWSHANNENDARKANSGSWSPSHFVPLMLPAVHNDSESSNQSTSTVMVY